MAVCFGLNQVADYLEDLGYPMQLVETAEVHCFEDGEVRPKFLFLVCADEVVSRVVCEEVGESYKLGCFTEDGRDLLEGPCVVCDGLAFWEDVILAQIAHTECCYTSRIDALTDGMSVEFLNFKEIPKHLHVEIDREIIVNILIS